MLQQIYPQAGHDFTYELNKDFQFAAAHLIPHEDAGKCAYMHGHTYFCNLTIVGNQLDHTGFLVNFHDLKKLVHDRYDHKVINDVPFLTQQGVDYVVPSTEAMAKEIHTIVQMYLDTLSMQVVCLQVFLRETPTSYVVYRPKQEDYNNLLASIMS
jgi:6-pyruvoyltetrahydropterin/6-carboxytetrahydropterin synthase